jgi:hypothetical protein
VYLLSPGTAYLVIDLRDTIALMVLTWEKELLLSDLQIGIPGT